MTTNAAAFYLDKRRDLTQFADKPLLANTARL